MNLLVGKVLEDLLERGLADWVLRDHQLVFVFFNQTKQEPNRLIIPQHFKFEKVTALLEKVNFLKLSSDNFDE